jgi:hypothetical protein
MDLYPNEWHLLMNETNWKQVIHNEKFQLYSCNIDHFSIPAIRIDMVLDIPHHLYLDVVWDVQNYPKNLPSAFTTEITKSTLEDSVQNVWQIIDIPFLSPRLYHYQLVRNKNSIDWYHLPTNLDDTQNYIFASANLGSWKVSNLNGVYVLTYIVLTDPGGFVPDWIVEKAQLNYLPKMLKEAEMAGLKKLKSTPIN